MEIWEACATQHAFLESLRPGAQCKSMQSVSLGPLTYQCDAGPSVPELILTSSLAQEKILLESPRKSF